jgi:glycosyltransferase involved in cell wall biosynthesis
LQIPNNLARYLRYCKMYGVKSATRLALRRLRKPRGAPPIDVTPLVPTLISEPEFGRVPIVKSVSVVIPTKNAGPEIRLLIRKLRTQEGVPQPEIILVDSGSTDPTLDIAQQEGVLSFPIASERFTHSFARNAGAERACGEYLLFMVQDALPMTSHWLWEMITALETNGLAAVSCAEYPRSDSDLFYQFLIHTQYNVSGLSEDRVMEWNDSCLSYLGLRANAQLSDVATLVRRNIFESFRYRTDYAEDLDLGIRLIRNGHRLGFLHNTRVLHSHNRPAYYFLKRGYVDVRYLADVFPNFSYPEIEDENRLFSDIGLLYDRIVMATNTESLLARLLAGKSSVEVLAAAENGADNLLERESKRYDPQFRQFVLKLDHGAAQARLRSQPQTGMLLPHVSRHVEAFQNWLSGIYRDVDVVLNEQVVSSIEKIFALHAGNHLAYLYLTRRTQKALDEALVEMDKTLACGV